MEHNVPQCGYCQAGQMMMAAALLRKNNDPSDQEIETDDVEHLSLRNLSAHSSCDQNCRKGVAQVNKPTPELTLRELIEQNRRETEIRPVQSAAVDPAVLNTAVFNPVTRRSFLAGLSAGSLC